MSLKINHLHANLGNVDIRKGEMFSETNLTTKRPGIGISPMKFNYYLKKIKKTTLKMI